MATRVTPHQNTSDKDHFVQVGGDLDEKLLKVRLPGERYIASDPAAQEILSWDTNGDGDIDYSEIRGASEALIKSRAAAKAWKRRFIFLGALAAVAIGVLLGTTIAANEISKDTKIGSEDETSELLDRGGNTVATATVQGSVDIFSLVGLPTDALYDIDTVTLPLSSHEDDILSVRVNSFARFRNREGNDTDASDAEATAEAARARAEALFANDTVPDEDALDAAASAVEASGSAERVESPQALTLFLNNDMQLLIQESFAVLKLGGGDDAEELLFEPGPVDPDTNVRDVVLVTESTEAAVAIGFGNNDTAAAASRFAHRRAVFTDHETGEEHILKHGLHRAHEHKHPRVRTLAAGSHVSLLQVSGSLRSSARGRRIKVRNNPAGWREVSVLKDGTIFHAWTLRDCDVSLKRYLPAKAVHCRGGYRAGIRNTQRQCISRGAGAAECDYRAAMEMCSFAICADLYGTNSNSLGRCQIARGCVKTSGRPPQKSKIWNSSACTNHCLKGLRNPILCSNMCTPAMTRIERCENVARDRNAYYSCTYRECSRLCPRFRSQYGNDVNNCRRSCSSMHPARARGRDAVVGRW